MSLLILCKNALIKSVIRSIAEDLQQPHHCVDTLEQAHQHLLQNYRKVYFVLIDPMAIDAEADDKLEKLKEASTDRYMPLIYLVDNYGNDDYRNYLQNADNVLVLSGNIAASQAQLKKLIQQIEGYRQLESRYYALRKSHRSTHQEHSIVESIFFKHFKKHNVETDNLKAYISPASVFNGDVFLTAMGPNGSLYIAIGDVTGHGLPAAVGALPVYATFRTMAQKGLGVGTIAAEMNKGLLLLLPTNMMMAVTLVEMDASGEQLTVWSGGMPPAIIEDGQGRIKQRIHSRHMPLAALEPDEFHQDIEIYKLNSGDRIYLMTDGVEESRNSRGEMFGEARLSALFDGQQTHLYQRIIDELALFTQNSQPDDDITLIELTAQPSELQYNLSKAPKSGQAIPWRLDLELKTRHLREADPIPKIIQMLNNAVGLDVHQDFISTILSELYGNALDHGILKLDSAMKESEDGFIEYYCLRQERLQALESGNIDIHVNFEPDNGGGLITLMITDSGDGFDYRQISSFEDIDSDQSFGRGMNIIASLCEHFSYSNGGRTAKAVYRID